MCRLFIIVDGLIQKTSFSSYMVLSFCIGRDTYDSVGISSLNFWFLMQRIKPLTAFGAFFLASFRKASNSSSGMSELKASVSSPSVAESSRTPLRFMSILRA